MFQRLERLGLRSDLDVALNLFSNFKWVGSSGYLSERLGYITTVSGPFLVSRTGDAIVTGCGSKHIALGFPHVCIGLASSLHALARSVQPLFFVNLNRYLYLSHVRIGPASSLHARRSLFFR